jgi:hypothetical protein
MPSKPLGTLVRLAAAAALLAVATAPSAVQAQSRTASRMVRVPGAEIHYREVGIGEPLLLLHGFGGCGSDWEPLVARLAGQYRVILVDPRGHGRSINPSRTFTMRQSAPPTWRGSPRRRSSCTATATSSSRCSSRWTCTGTSRPHSSG